MTNKKHCQRYDAYFNSKTNEWLETACKDRFCEFCADRPVKHKVHKNGDGSICG